MNDIIIKNLESELVKDIKRAELQVLILKMAQVYWKALNHCGLAIIVYPDGSKLKYTGRPDILDITQRLRTELSDLKSYSEHVFLGM